MGLNEATFSCTILKKDDRSIKSFLFICAFLIPCFVIIVSYSCIYWKVKCQRKQLSSYNGPVASRKEGKVRPDDSRLTKMMLIIFISYMLCYFPLSLANVVGDKYTPPWLSLIGSVFAWAASVINPFIYAFSNSSYRQAYMNLFKLLKFGQKDFKSENVFFEITDSSSKK